MGALLRPASECRRLAGALALSLVGHVAVLVLSGVDGRLGLAGWPVAEQHLIAHIGEVVDQSRISGSGDAPRFGEAFGEDTPVVLQDGAVSRYVTPDLLTTRPAPLEPVQIPAPESASFTGQVVLRVYVGVFGNVDQVELIDSMVPDSYVAGAIRAIKQQRFLPGRIGEKAVPTFTDIEIEFNPPD